jgi:hypothetical protein
MWKVVDMNFISFVIQQSCREQIVFKEKERVLDFSFNQLIDGLLHKMIQAKWQGLRWYNDMRLDECDVV